MAPRESSSTVAATPSAVVMFGEEDDSLQERIAKIALQARERNPDGFKLEPVERIRSRSSSPNSSLVDDDFAGRQFLNQRSGQKVVLLCTTRNVPSHLVDI
mmetsp:Transcript_12683/g.23550  ORF Transcript_12683/g.23550 Transcript_12683/m.23550 type:complete len:101 (+) Transcript_12683:59-361(+)